MYLEYVNRTLFQKAVPETQDEITISMDMVVAVASYPWIMYIHGYPIAAMDMMNRHGNRYILMVTSHPSHGQNSTNRLYLPMDMPP